MTDHSKKSLSSQKVLQTEGINMEMLLNRFKRFWYMFVIFSAITIGAAWLFLRYQTPIYSVSTAVLIKDEKNKRGISTSDLLPKDLGHSSEKAMLPDEIRVMTSHTVLEEVIQRLKLDRTVFLRGTIKSTELYGQDSPIQIDNFTLADTTKIFKAALDVKDSQNFQLTLEDDSKQDCQFGVKFRNRYGDFLIQKISNHRYADKKKFTIICKGLEKAAKDLSKGIDIDMPKKESNILEPTIKSAVPEKAKNILQEMIAVYNRNNVEDKNEISKNTLEFIGNRLSSLTGELSGVERNVENYKIQEGITSDGNSDIGYFFGRLGEYDGELVKLEVQNSLLSSIEAVLKKSENTYELLPTNLELKSTGLQSQISDYNRMILERNRLLKTAGDSHPNLKNLSEDLKNLKNAIFGNIGRVKDENNALLVQTQSKNMQYADKLGSTPRKDRKLTEIKRQQNIKEGLYLFLLQKQEETAISIAGALSDARMIERPIVGDAPLSTKKPFVYFIALLLGIIVGMIYAILQDFMTNTVQSESDITAQTAMPIIGKIPHCKTKNNLVVQAGSRSAVAEMFRLLRSDIQFSLEEFSINTNNFLTNKGHVVMVTCTSSGEGKSFISMNLGMSLALAKKKTVVVGLDLRRPKLSEYLSIPKGKNGITEYLQTSLQPKEIILESEQNDNLYFIPSGEIPLNPSELIMSSKMERLFTYLKEHFDYIIIDTPPIGLVSDASLLKPFVDMTLYVVRYGHTKRAHLGTINKFYERKKLSNPSIVFNSVKWDEEMGYGTKHEYYTSDKKTLKGILNGVASIFW